MELKPIDLSVFKGLKYDLDEVGFALSLAEPGQEALGLARKAVDRLGAFLEQNVSDPVIGMASNIFIIRRGLESREARSLFSPPADLGRAREAFECLRTYVEGLEKAWAVCLLAPGRADSAAVRKMAG